MKIFMGSSTGNLLVDNYLTLDRIFGGMELLIATHCEDEEMIRQNLENLKKHKAVLQPSDHAVIRNDEVCFESSFKAVQLAKKHNSRLHILHISTEKELQLFTNMIPLADKRITAEVCVHHLHFSSNDYKSHGNLIKCNPAIKPAHNREALWPALLDDRLDVIATDHAPHLLSEKHVDEEGGYEKAHAGLPLVQHSLLIMLDYYQQGRISLEMIAKKMSHDVAICFSIRDRGFIREGYYADLVMVDIDAKTKVQKNNILYKCGWSPFEGVTFSASILKTFVNGNLVYDSQAESYGNKVWNESSKGKRLQFNR